MGYHLEYRPDHDFETGWGGEGSVVPVEHVGVARQKIGQWKLLHNVNLVFFLLQNFHHYFFGGDKKGGTCSCFMIFLPIRQQACQEYYASL